MGGRYVMEMVDKPYIVRTFDCPGLLNVLVTRKLLPRHCYERISVNEYEDEFRFSTIEYQYMFKSIVEDYLNGLYDEESKC